MDKKEELMKIFAPQLRKIVERAEVDYEDLQEIRLRVNMPMMMIYKNHEYMFREDGGLVQ